MEEQKNGVNERKDIYKAKQDPNKQEELHEADIPVRFRIGKVLMISPNT